jgi:hypothetical protein
MNQNESKLPYIHFYCADWQTDAKLQSCSLAARGLWTEILFLMHDSEIYGHLVHNGEPMSAELLSRLIRTNQTEVEILINELEKARVFSRDENEIIFSRRLLRDQNKRKTNRSNGAKGGNPSLKKRRKTTQNDGENDVKKGIKNDVKNDENDGKNDAENDSQIIDSQNRDVSRLTDVCLPLVNRKRDNDYDNDNDNDNDYLERNIEKKFDFDSFWNLYDKKVDLKKCRQKFDKLSKVQINKIEIHLSKYVASEPDKQFRKNPLTYLFGECWNDQIIHKTKNHDDTNSNKQQTRSSTVDNWSAFAKGRS